MIEKLTLTARQRKWLSVLVAEDDALINEGTANQLKRLGYAVAGQAYDGPQAVQLAGQEHPAVVLMDLQMIDPETGREDARAGLKAAWTIHEGGSAAVVLLTAHESPDLVRLASQAGVSAYVVKPVRDNDLDRAISISRARHDDLLELRRLNCELQRHVENLHSALSQAKALSGLLPICSACKNIRDEQGEWHPIETYIQDHSEARFTHGLCLDCCAKLYPGILSKDRKAGTPD